MDCQRCQMHPATRQWMDAMGHSYALCEVCLTQVQVFGTLQKMLLPALMPPHLPAQQSCPVCHQTWQELNQLSHLGCPQCYRHFRLSLEPSLARLHGQTLHTGRRPARAAAGAPSVDWLKEQLDLAVREERYEDAVQWRDQLRACQPENP
jgi:protein arginine kinase activator